MQEKIALINNLTMSYYIELKNGNYRVACQYVMLSSALRSRQQNIIYCRVLKAQ